MESGRENTRANFGPVEAGPIALENASSQFTRPVSCIIIARVRIARW